MNQQQARFAYEFGDFRIDPQRRVLMSRMSGEPVTVTGKVFDTLLYLVEHAGELLDKRTLMEALWPRVVVEEGNLTQTIHTLRRILGERPGEHRYIVTVPGRGYRFVAPVTTCEIQEEPRASLDSHSSPRSSRRRSARRTTAAAGPRAPAGPATPDASTSHIPREAAWPRR